MDLAIICPGVNEPDGVTERHETGECGKQINSRATGTLLSTKR
jgi:hypothetical protein